MPVLIVLELFACGKSGNSWNTVLNLLFEIIKLYFHVLTVHENMYHLEYNILCVWWLQRKPKGRMLLIV